MIYDLTYINDYRKKQSGYLEELRSNLREIDIVLDQGGVSDVILQRRLEILKNLHDINSANACDYMQKAKIQWAIEGDENSKFFHGIINRKHANLAIKGVMADGEWVDDPCRVKEEFRLHFANWFRAPNDTRKMIYDLTYINDYRKKQSGYLEELRSNLREIDIVLDQGGVSDVILQRRLEILKNLHDINSANACDYMQKAKIQWAIKGDENSKFFHGIINRKRANLAIKGVMADGEWVDDPCRVKKEFRLHFANRFRAPNDTRYKLNFPFSNKLSSNQMAILESPISRSEVRNAVWGSGENKSLGPDGFSFEFFRKFWDILGSDFCDAVEWFFDRSYFARGCNSSFIDLISKNQDPKLKNTKKRTKSDQNRTKTGSVAKPGKF
nr:RNA-directed DNA polymerase, eukaryota [Tanacetum cinerariifolium]